MSAPIVDRVIGEWRVGPEEWDEAIAAVDGPQLVVAGPGTGKTEFLVRRVTHLLESGHDPTTILVLTFSRRGATDLRARIAAGASRSLGPLSVSTFHSLAIRLLEKHDHSSTRRGTPPTLLTGPEQVALVAELLASEDPGPWPVSHRAMLATRTFAADVADFLLRMAERRIGSEDLRAMVDRRPDWRALPDFADRYANELISRHRIDYGTLLSRAVDLTDEMESGVAPHYVVVDEYQDTAPAQAELLERLTRVRRNLTVTGDPRQSIYGFRGADVRNIATFVDRFSTLGGLPARRIVLDTSFRVPAAVLHAAERVSVGAGLPGTTHPVTPAPHAGDVEVHVFDQASAEAEWVAAEVERLHLLEGVDYRRMAVLVRSTRHLLPELSRALDRRLIPHDTPDTRLVDHPAVQLLLDLALATSLASSDDPLAGRLAEGPIRRVLLSPLYDLGVAAERALRRQKARHGSTWIVALESDPSTSDLASLLGDAGWATRLPAKDGFWHIWDHLPRLTRFALAEGHREHRSAWTAFAQVLEQQHERDPSVTLLRYREMTESDDFEATPLLSHRTSDEDRITLTTLHQAKGLEFDAVFIADATEDVFPDLRRGFNPLDPQALAGDTDRSTWLVDRLREEARLAYTAMTRARHRLVMTATTAGIDEGERRPSRFLLAAAGVGSVDDLPPPPSRRHDPLTPRGLETVLRRTLMDPAAPLASRLAAAATLAEHTPRLWNAWSFAGVREPGPERGVFTRPPRLSPTQAESYRECPRRYVFERRLAMTDTSGDHARFGTLLHTVLEQADEAARSENRPRPELGDALARLDAVWDAEAAFGSPWLDEIWRRKAVDLLERLFDGWPEDSAATIAAERTLRWNGGGVEWVGRADRIERLTDGTVRVVDYKTSASILSKEKAARSLQLAFYALAASSDPELPGPVCSAELWYPATKLKSYRRALDMEALDELEDTLVGLATAILEERWEPTPGEACERCSVRIVCPEWPEGREAFST
ncbi:MAG TPA: ATP-dependent DNA helicase [Acidimicrobiia bacterium]|nr:ATP-dependent DNA helicase [Acidimicrobiia bacterium]